MSDVKDWIKQRIRTEEIEKYFNKTGHFIPHQQIYSLLSKPVVPDRGRVKDILEKAMAVETLSPEEVAYLIKIDDSCIWEQIYQTAFEVKKKVYDNRIVTFAPLYLSNYCVNNCLYCGFRKENSVVKRRQLSLEEVRSETEVLAGEIGHKRLIVVYGEHPNSGIDYIVETIRTIYKVKVPTRKGFGSIRRVNVNAPPMQLEELKDLKAVGIGTYQVFQETYHQPTYEYVHPKGTIKHNYLWRLYTMHRAMEAGIDDVGLGVLFGLYDWKFEVLALVYHSLELEHKFGVGPHTISFPRLEPAINTPFLQQAKYKVTDQDFKKIIALIRIAVPYTGLIITAREPAHIRDEMMKIGVTQTDASTKIGIGAYTDRVTKQELERQQFQLGDTRSLEELIRDLAKMGFITSFCTAGYRCGRTGENIMKLLKTGQEGKFCKLNAVLTFKEWLDDFAGEETRRIGEQLIQKELEEIKEIMPDIFPKLIQYYEKISSGERDLYF